MPILYTGMEIEVKEASAMLAACIFPAKTHYFLHCNTHEQLCDVKEKAILEQGDDRKTV